ncbi:MAG TPA: methionyl-tRNA formyltransferase, partial [Stellaceae bacterium]|nr:methionyl-tRNA formyltransferase [Stellaceae bacterium]
MGTADFAATILAALIDAGHTILAAYTQPPRPAGRGHRPQSSPVQVLAEQNAILVRSPQSLRSPEVQAEFAALGADL